MRKYLAEFIGTACLVLFGCGSAVFIEQIGILGVAFAFGLSIVAMAYCIGGISGCHINPAVSFGMLLARRMDVMDFVGYVVAQFLGAITGAALLMLIKGQLGVDLPGLGTNGFGAQSSYNITLLGAIVTEVLLTFFFVLTILGVTADKEKGSVAGLVIALTLVLVHILGINLTGTSVNPARSFGPALLAGGEALKQVWVFIVAPLVGAGFAAAVYTVLSYKRA